jgi:hypothetical protein
VARCWDDDYSSEWLDVTRNEGCAVFPDVTISTGKFNLHKTGQTAIKWCRIAY